jgi:AcrR family transcriptional regulator
MTALLKERASSRTALLEAGWRIAERGGLRRLTVRAVAKEARANLGSFVYHFGTRDAFVRELIEAWYAPLFAGVALSAGGEGSASARLRRALEGLIGFALERGAFVARLITDAAGGERAAREFLGSLAGRHPQLLLALAREAQREGSLLDEDPLHMLLFIMSSVGLPLLIASGAPPEALSSSPFAAALARLARDRALAERRLGWALAALSPGGRS